jgi:hypothetical protein
MLRKGVAAVAIALGAALFAPNPATAQVKQVEMDIAGYLCGF